MRHPRVTTTLLGSALLLLPGAASAQDGDQEWLDRCEDSHHGDEVFCEVRPLSVQSTGSVDLAVTNGVIDLEGGEQADVRLRARVRGWGNSDAQAREMAQAVRIEVDGGRVRANGPRTGRGEGWSVDFVGTVPRRYDVELSTQNGPLSLRDVSGLIDVESQNGPVALHDIGGVVRAQASNGPVHLELVDRSVPEGGIDVRTSNGPLTVVVPRAINGRLEASTQNGPISTNLDVDIRRQNRYAVSGDIEATLGQGGGTIRARTSNGPLTVRTSD